MPLYLTKGVFMQYPRPNNESENNVNNNLKSNTTMAQTDISKEKENKNTSSNADANATDQANDTSTAKNESIKKASLKFYRSEDGIFFGVCQGLGESFGIKPPLLRIIWFLSFFYYGVGILLYLALAISLPRKDKLDKALNRQILGVCGILSKRFDIEVGLVRLLALTLLFFTGGFAFLFYVVLYFAFDTKKE